MPDGLFEQEEVEITKVVDASQARKYTLTGVVPWSQYKITLYVLNEDGLKTNPSSTDIEMPEGGM